MKRLLILLAAVFAIGAGSANAVTFKWAADGDAFSMDPYAFNEAFTLGFTSNMFDGLVSRGKDLKIEPGLATAWKMTSPTTWEFTLRRGVKFHDGTPFTSADVVFSWQRGISAGSDMKGYFITVEKVEAKDANTVVITTKGPDPILTANISYWWILSKTWCEKNGATEVADLRKGQENFATRNANGTGPFSLVSRQADVRTVLKRNPDWWGWKAGHGNSNVDEVILTPIKQDATRVAALLSGDVDMVYHVPAQDTDRIKAAKLKVIQGPEARTIFIGMDQYRDELLESDVKGKNPFKDKRVRQAMYQAIDTDAIVKTIMRGVATPAWSMAQGSVTGSDNTFKRYPFNPDAAKKLLADAGYPNGFSVGFDCPNDRYVNDERICQAVTAMWAKIGINAKLLAQPKATYFPKMLGGKSSVYLLGWAPATVDGKNVLDNLLVTPNDTTGLGRFNKGGYSNAKVDDLAAKAQSEPDQAKRTAMLREGLNLAHSDVGSIPLHFQFIIYGSKPGVDLVLRPDDNFHIRWVTVK